MAATEELRSADGAPDDLERYFLFQTLAGAWPIERERVAGYMEKALREAKRNTNWVEQNGGWEHGVRAFVEALYEPQAVPARLRAVRRAGGGSATGSRWACSR